MVKNVQHRGGKRVRTRVQLADLLVGEGSQGGEELHKIGTHVGVRPVPERQIRDLPIQSGLISSIEPIFNVAASNWK